MLRQDIAHVEHRVIERFADLLPDVQLMLTAIPAPGMRQPTRSRTSISDTAVCLIQCSGPEQALWWADCWVAGGEPVSVCWQAAPAARSLPTTKGRQTIIAFAGRKVGRYRQRIAPVPQMPGAFFTGALGNFPNNISFFPDILLSRHAS